MLNQPSIISFQGKKVAILGLGVNNAELPDFLLEQGAVVTVCDRNSDLPQTDSRLDYRLGPDYLKSLTDFDIIFRTPGLPYLLREIQEARAVGTIITSQTKYFLERCPGTVIGVTGTKGKGTTASLIELILQQAQERGELAGDVYLAGNIGVSPLTFLPRLTEKDWVVLELSSFQLQDLTTSPDIAVVLTITPDHLDYHRDEAEYIAAKKSIVRYQTPGDFAVLNLDSLTSILFADETVAQTYFFSREKSVDQGCFVEHRLGTDQIILRMPEQEDQIICSIDAVQLVGAYNLENVTAAIAAAALAGASSESCRLGVSQFRGLPHRLQLVVEKNGIRYFDDSKATTPESTIEAILSFDQPITLIVGGSPKGADYQELIEVIRSSSVKHVITLGREGERISQLLAEQGIISQPGGITMVEIVQQAAALSEPGSVVLLSPAAASFDMFANAEDRGNQFQAAVRQLTSDSPPAGGTSDK